MMIRGIVLWSLLLGVACGACTRRNAGSNTQSKQTLNHRSNSNEVSTLTEQKDDRLDNPIRRVDFDNLRYSKKPIYPSKPGTFKLKDGRFRGYPGIPGDKPPFGDPYPVSLVALAYGDVTGDGEEEALVVLTQSHPGTAITYYIYVYTIEKKRPKSLWAVETGDRAQGGLRKVYAENGELVIELYGGSARVDGNVFGDEMSACCPSSFTRTRYRWARHHFVQSGESGIIHINKQGASLEMEYREPD
jgi:hypothetical protein